MIKYLMLISFTVFGGRCPPDPKNVIIFIDTCPTNEADYLTDFGSAPCLNDHADQVLKTYKIAGGKKKIWLFTFFRKDYNINPYTKAVELAMECGVKVISTSTTSDIGDSFNWYESNLINRFVRLGGRYYASAGNYGKNLMIYPVYPAAFENVIAVGAKNCNNENPEKYYVAKYSNYGHKVKFWACGDNPFDVNSKGTSFAVPRLLASKEG